MSKNLTKEQLQEIKMIINGSRSNGMSDQEIYNELRYRYRYDEKRKIYCLITGTTTEESRNKYRILNNILILILTISLLLNILLILSWCLSDETKLIPSLILGLLIICLPIVLMKEIIKYNGCIYKHLGVLFAVSCLKVLESIIAHVGEMGCLYLVNIILPISGAIISFYIAKKVFPNYKIFPSKDRQGDYIIDEE